MNRAGEADDDERAFLEAVQPVADALGAELVRVGDLEPADVPLHWHGRLVGGLRLPVLQGAMARLIDGVERELGGQLGQLSREDKQRAVWLLEQRGAFTLRRSVEEVADALGVSRITVYNYLNALRDEPAPLR